MNNCSRDRIALPAQLVAADLVVELAAQPPVRLFWHGIELRAQLSQPRLARRMAPKSFSAFILVGSRKQRINESLSADVSLQPEPRIGSSVFWGR